MKRKGMLSILDSYTDSDLKEIYLNLIAKEEDFYGVEISDLSKSAISIMKNVYGREYRYDTLYAHLAHYFAQKHIKEVV